MPFRATNAPIGPQSSGSARRWPSFEGELHVERFRVTLNGLGGFHMGNPGSSGPSPPTISLPPSSASASGSNKTYATNFRFRSLAKVIGFRTDEYPQLRVGPVRSVTIGLPDIFTLVDSAKTTPVTVTYTRKDRQSIANFRHTTRSILYLHQLLTSCLSGYLP